MDEMTAIDVVMDRVCAKLEKGAALWARVPHEEPLVVLYTDHFTDAIHHSRRALAARTRTAGLDEYLEGCGRDCLR